MLYFVFSLLISILGLILWFSNKKLSFIILILSTIYLGGTPYRIIQHIQGGISTDYLAGFRDILIFIAFFSLYRRKITYFTNKYKINIYMITLLLMYLISILLTAPDILIGIWGFRWAVTPILFGFIVTNSLSNRESNKLIRFFAIILLLLSLYGTIQFYKIPDIDMPYGLNIEYMKLSDTMDEPLFTGTKLRTYSFTYGITEMTHTIPQLGIFFIVLFFIYRFKTPRIFILSILSYLIWLIIVKESAPIGVTMIGILTLFIFMGMLKKKYINIILSLLIIFAYFQFRDYVSNVRYIENAKITRIYNLGDPLGRGTGRARLYIWEYALGLFLKKPYGHGVGIARGSSVSQKSGRYYGPHNMYLQNFLEIGIIGGFVFIIILYKVIKYLIHNYRDKFYSPLIRNQSLAVLCSSVGLLAYGMFSVPLDRAGGMTFWTLIGLISSQVENHYNSNEVNY